MQSFRLPEPQQASSGTGRTPSDRDLRFALRASSYWNAKFEHCKARVLCGTGTVSNELVGEEGRSRWESGRATLTKLE